MFAHVRAAANTELDKAQAALTDATAIHMSVISAHPDEAYVEEIYTTYQVQALVLQRLGRLEEANRLVDLARSRHLDGLPALLRAQQQAPGSNG